MSSGELKLVLTHGCYSLITINFNLPRGVHIRNALHVLSTYSCELKSAFARGCYSLITTNFIIPRVRRFKMYQEWLACSKYVFLQTESVFFHVVATHSSHLITINFKLPPVAHIRNGLHVPSMRSRKLKVFFSTWLLLTHHNEPHTATCRSYREGFACSQYAFLQAKTNFGT